jgi:DNA-binding response OmpR family regulator
MRKILIIFDSASIRESLAEALAADGYLVVPIGRSSLARDMILTLAPDLVLLDLHIDEKDKEEVLEEIKKQAPHIRVLGLTPHDHTLKDLGGSPRDVYVMKTPCFSGLRHKIAAVLQPKVGHSKELKESENHSI